MRRARSNANGTTITAMVMLTLTMGPGNRASLYPWAAVVEPKDVVIAILGASAALGGFVLVFLGIIIASYQSYSGGVPDQVVQPYRTTGSALLGTFGLSLVTAAICF